MKIKPCCVSTNIKVDNSKYRNMRTLNTEPLRSNYSSLTSRLNRASPIQEEAEQREASSPFSYSIRLWQPKTSDPKVSGGQVLYLLTQQSRQMQPQSECWHSNQTRVRLCIHSCLCICLVCLAFHYRLGEFRVRMDKWPPAAPAGSRWDG